MIGIGARDDIYYIKYFKENFKVKFPLFPDKDLAIHEMLGGPKTPYFIVLKFDKNGDEKIIFTNLGKIPGATEFINLIQEKAEMK